MNSKSLVDVDLVTPKLIEDIVHKIKSNKKDPVFTFNSDCLKHAPSSFYHHLARIIRIFLIHGHVSSTLLTATIMPLIKDKLGDAECSDNYRSIALSSVILKVFDWVIITLFGDKLCLDELQFSYQQNCSTNMCTWLVVESINHFLRNGSDVYTCFMDMKKAFDMVKHAVLFKKLIERNVPPVFLRLLLVMYLNQNAVVKWEGSVSDAFAIINGVKQGAVLSAVLFCIYIDDLLKEMRRNRDGCWINMEYVGIIVYADEVVRNLQLNKKSLPWVTSVKHLGTTITNIGGCKMDQDLIQKKAMYIAKNNEIIQEFHFAHPRTKVWINNVYNSCFYGAPLWDTSSKNFEKLEKSWNVSCRQMLSLPRNTHRYFIEDLTKTHHIVKSLEHRFLRFIRKIADGPKKVLRRILDVLKYDARSVTGGNLRRIRIKTETNNENDYNPYDAPYRRIPAEETWRVSLMDEVIALRTGNLYPNMTFEQLNDICEFVCGT